MTKIESIGMNIEAKVLAIIASAIGCDIENLNLDDDLIEKFGVDSMDFFEMSFELENEFNIEMPTELHRNVRTVRALILLVKKQVRANCNDMAP